MKHFLLHLVAVTALLTAAAASLRACSLCDSQLKLSPTFRQEAALDSARLILHGVVRNPRLT